MQNEATRSSLRVLLVEDDENDALLMARHLRKLGYAVDYRQVWRLEALRDAIENDTWDIIIADYGLPGFTALDALAVVQSTDQDLPFLVISGTIDDETACRLMQAGARDYLSKNKLDRLVPVIERELREAGLRRERVAALKAERATEARFRALAANVPGVLFQMRAMPSGALDFLYVSEASQMLLGLPHQTLTDSGKAFTNLIVAEDREDFTRALSEAAIQNATLNWEGRVHPREMDIKWINVRCSPRPREEGGILWEGVMWNITQSKLAEIELRASRAQLAELSAHLQRIKEEERDRIARDIHDVLGGTLVGIKISASLLAGKLDADDALRERVRNIETMLDDAITTAGRVARELRPGILKEFGLAAAVESYAEDFSQRTGIACQVLCADGDIETRDDTALALFRTYQEALTNVTKHAQAQKVEVRLMQEDEDIVLEVSDNGRGIGSADLIKPRSFGLRSIRERLHALGGTMDIGPGARGGTQVTMRVPAHATRAELSVPTGMLAHGSIR
ncbi:MAG: histidine kinase [Rhodocyclaceae bacterium]